MNTPFEKIYSSSFSSSSSSSPPPIGQKQVTDTWKLNWTCLTIIPRTWFLRTAQSIVFFPALNMLRVMRSFVWSLTTAGSVQDWATELNPRTQVFLIFFPRCSIKHQHMKFYVAVCLSFPRILPAYFERRLAMVSYYGYEIWHHN